MRAEDLVPFSNTNGNEAEEIIVTCFLLPYFGDVTGTHTQ